jgi:hypothetical protein
MVGRRTRVVVVLAMVAAILTTLDAAPVGALPPSPGIAGEVRDATNVLLAGINVRIFDADTAALVTTATTQAVPLGSWEVAVPQGTYLIRFEDPSGEYAPTWLGQVDVANHSSVVAVGAGPAPFVNVELLRARGVISGDVRDQVTNSPLEDVAVTLIDARTGITRAPLATNAFGGWSDTVPVGVPYLVRYEKSGYDPQLNSSVEDVRQATPVTASPFSPSLAPTASLTPDSGDLRGRVADAATFDALPDMDVTVFDASTGDVAAELVTDSGGFWSTSLSTHRTYLVRLSDPAGVYGAEWIQDQAGATAAVRAHTNPVSPTSLDATLSIPAVPTGPGTRSGGARDLLTGDPLEGIHVVARDVDTLAIVASDTTDADGAYELHLAAGSYLFHLDDPTGPYQPLWLGPSTDAGTATVVDVTAASVGFVQDTYLSVVAGATGLAHIPVVAFRDAHSPIPPIDISEQLAGVVPTAVDSMTGLPVAVGLPTDVDGHSIIEVPAPGSYFVHFDDPTDTFRDGLQNSTSAVVVDIGDTNVGAGRNFEIDFDSTPTGTSDFDAQVREDAHFTALPGIEVTLIRQATLERYTGVTSPLGHVSIPGIPAPARYLVQFRDPTGVYGCHYGGSDCAFARDDFAVGLGTSVVVQNLHLPPISEQVGEAGLSGTVTDGTSALPGITVRVFDSSTGDQVAETLTSGTGGWAATVPTPIDALIRFSDGGVHATEWYDDEATAPDATPVPAFVDDDVTGLDAVLGPPVAPPTTGQIHGDVFGPTGGVDGAAVRIYDTATLALVREVPSGPSGHFDVEVPAPGQYAVRVVDPSGLLLPAWSNGDDEIGIAPIDVPPGFMATTSVSLHAAVGRMEFGVDDGSLPIEGATVEVFDPMARLAGSTETDAAGEAALELPVGTYYVRFSDDAGGYLHDFDSGATELDEAFDHHVAEGRIEEVRSRLRRPIGHVDATVLDTSPSPLEGIDVIVLDLTTLTEVGRGSTEVGHVVVDVPVPLQFAVRFEDPSGHYLPQFYRDADSFGGFEERDLSTIGETQYVDARLDPNLPPTAANDAYATNEDTALNVAAPGVLSNDTDPDTSTLTAVLVSGPTHGTLTLNDDGSFGYVPTSNYDGPDSFTYSASDGASSSDPATVSLTVNPVNDPPSAANDGYATNEDTPLNVVAPGVLSNDSDVEGSPLGAASVTGPSHGSLTVGADGSVLYSPSTNYNGGDSFTYRASDGTALSSPATVSLTVNPVNDVPQVTGVTCSAVNAVSVGTSVSANATYSDPDGPGGHSASIDWGDGSSADSVGTVTEATSTVTKAHVYNTPGLFTVSVSVSDGALSSAGSCPSLVAVFDRNGSAVTGGGWFNSPAGADPQAPTRTGSASFAFTAKYGKTGPPDGNAEFKFDAANLSLKATSFDSLIASGPRAFLLGSASVNNVRGYSFLMSVNDGAAQGGGGVDRFRMRIWRQTGATVQVIYDNQPGAALNASPTLPLTTGDITVAKPKK